ncbi:glutaminase [Fusobacterium necrophorum subsp. necrophorum]|nr:glutaminase [Fusobacterium necrophorum subsp. necrophorum]
MQDLLRKIVEKNKKLTDLGAVANYIPELDKADKNALGICVMDMEGNQFCYGECVPGLPFRVFLKLFL